MKRFSLRSSAAARLSAAGGLPKWWKQFYTEESVNQRVKLMQHPKVKHALDQLWTAANFNADDEIIDKEEYLMMHRKIVLALEPGTHPLVRVRATLTLTLALALTLTLTSAPNGVLGHLP